MGQTETTGVLASKAASHAHWALSGSRSVVSDSLRPHRLQPARLLGPWASPGKNTGVDCPALLQGILLTQGSNPWLLQRLHLKQILYPLSHRGSPYIYTYCIYIVHIIVYVYSFRASPVAQTVKRLPAIQETRVRFLGWEDPLEKEMAIHSSTLA